jgi:hypothetical protein
MSRGIFLIGEAGDLVEMREQPYDSEELLQRLLATYPTLVPGDQVDPAQPRRWLFVARELTVPSEEGGGARWYLDHLLLDQDAIPTLVEVKRSTDSRIRREVVGQMLDYAANAVVYWPVEHLQAAFSSSCTARGADPDMELRLFLGEERTPEAYWQDVKTNLQAGRVRLLFIADIIPVELRAIVEFLNKQMDPAEVLAVEIRQFTNGLMRTLVPTVIGQTVEAQQKKNATGAQTRQWDEKSFFTELELRVPAPEVRVIREIFDWAQRNVSRVWFGRGATMPSLVPIERDHQTDHQLFAVYGYEKSASIEIYFQYYKAKPPFESEELRRALLERLNSIPGVSLPADSIGRRPSIKVGVLAAEGNTARFLETFEWFLQQVRAVRP